jgi:hypothetical protein
MTAAIVELKWQVFLENLADASLRTRPKPLLHDASRRFVVDGQEAEIRYPGIRRWFHSGALGRDVRHMTVRLGSEWHHAYGECQHRQSFDHARHLKKTFN